MQFPSEFHLVNAFCRHLLSEEELGIDDFSTEFNYGRGKIDIVMKTREGSLVGIEAKLSRWRDALRQAFRSSTFCDHSYVLLPLEAAKVAVNNRDLFNQLGVGLCTITHRGVEMLIASKKNRVLQSGLRDRALETI